ncbi:hypothetical protein M408DRAFT_30932 [Serendipita vermifera MAFF 305830]|uniref:Uncharacterized protein n=1 Tax=Serendipita vermifera MAFF 305830 TaxID=933852 RepID=A0A0C2WQ73_SERVB|nr:hypothetical protein M408DRAFT_30932 [Serendipita vermifera MAFF 305830]
MLERRNHLPPSFGISRITTLTLQSPIPPTLLAPLTHILSGQFTERPSNFELSFCRFIEEYLDISLPGCWTCFRSFLHCGTPAEIYDFWIPYYLVDLLTFHQLISPNNQSDLPISNGFSRQRAKKAATLCAIGDDSASVYCYGTFFVRDVPA